MANHLDISCKAPGVKIALSSDAEAITAAAAATTDLGVFATRTFTLGDTIISVKRPLIVALDSARLADCCYECYRRVGDAPVEVQLGFPPYPGGVAPDIAAGNGLETMETTILHRCAGCQAVRYCGKACQRSSWKSHHSLECPIFKTINLSTNSVPNHVRALLRLLLLRNAVGGRVKDDDWRAFLSCPSHRDAHIRRADEDLAVLTQAAKAIKHLSNFDGTEDMVLGMLFRLKINSITLQSQFHDPLGLALHPIVAKVNHSCNPNSYIQFPDMRPDVSQRRQRALKFGSGGLVLCPLREISVGEEISISYIDENMPLRYRQRELQQRYFFTCQCTRCSAEKKLVAKSSGSAQARIHQLQDQGAKLLDTDDTDATISLQDDKNALTSCIKTLLNDELDWPLDRYPFPQLLHRLILNHIDRCEFAGAFRLAALLQSHIDPKVYSTTPLHPLALTHTLLLIKLAGALLDALAPAATDAADFTAVQLGKEIDLEVLHRTLIERLVENANLTWTEQPWPWMRNIISQSRSREQISSTKLAHEKERLDTLCIRTMQVLKQG